MSEDERNQELLAGYAAERAMLVAALEQIDRFARQAIFGGWRHTVADITGIALGRAESTKRTRQQLKVEPLGLAVAEHLRKDGE